MTTLRRVLIALVLAVIAAGDGRATGDSDYIIGPEDILSVVFWHDKDMSCDVVVRPDGKISLPLVNDIQAGGLTPSQLREAIDTLARRYIEEPAVSVVVKQINSRKVFITGQVEKPGPYAITGRTTVLQLISMAGGLKEYVDGKRILVMRTDASGRQAGHQFNYREVVSGRNLGQNIELRPGDTVVVP
jgi:polysaccharide biosynthesis/export protein